MIKLKRQIKSIVKFTILSLHRTMLRLGLVVLPNHYYTPVADMHKLKETRKYWAIRAPMHGIDVNPASQMAWLQEHVAPFESEYRGNARYHEGVTAGYGPGYGYIEAQCLHGVVRSLRPKRIIEVGCGVSTHIMLGALERNAAEGHSGLVTCIDPYPSDFLKARDVNLITGFVEQLDPAIFDVLEAGDMLFIDSTHAVRPGGDVVFLYLSVIPRLKPGVIVHIHDIFLPYLHQRDLLNGLFQWEETALLVALLTDNRRLSILTCLSQLHYDDIPGLTAVFPEYRHEEGADGLNNKPGSAHFPASIYLTIS